MPKTKPTHNQTVKALEQVIKDPSITKQEYIRVQAVLMKKKGFTVEQIMRANGNARVTVEGWITAFNQEGVGGLKTKPQTSHYIKLTEEQKIEIKTLMHGCTPTEYGYTQEFWSIPILKDFIKTKFKVMYKSEKSYQDLFAFCGFSYQKAEYIDHRKDDTDPKKFKVRLRKRLKRGTFSMSW